MNRRLFGFALVLLSVSFLSAQQQDSQLPQAPPNVQTTKPPSGSVLVFQHQQPSPEAMRHIFDMRQKMTAHAIAINDLASHIQSPDDARKLVDLVAAEFSDELPPKWATRSFRDRIAQAEYETAADPGALIPEQHIADVWNEFIEKIGAPQETMLNAAEIHYLRDGQHLTARIGWTYEKDIWTVTGVFAVGPDGRVANGSRALEAIRLLWNLGNETEDFAAIHTDVQKGVLPTDQFLQAQKQRSPGGGQPSNGFAVARVMSIASYPVRQAAFRYVQEHGERSFEHIVEGLLKELLQ
jgi:hypothetical protein